MSASRKRSAINYITAYKGLAFPARDPPLTMGTLRWEPCSFLPFYPFDPLEMRLNDLDHPFKYIQQYSISLTLAAGSAERASQLVLDHINGNTPCFPHVQIWQPFRTLENRIYGAQNSLMIWKAVDSMSPRPLHNAEFCHRR